MRPLHGFDMKDVKVANPIKLAEYVMAANIADELAFDNTGLFQRPNQSTGEPHTNMEYDSPRTLRRLCELTGKEGLIFGRKR